MWLVATVLGSTILDILEDFHVQYHIIYIAPM